MAAKQFYFAWVDPGTAFDPLVHARRDEPLIALHVEQEEGDFASLDLTVKNPYVGLLSAGRKVWAWLSWFDGTTLHPLFYGRLVGIPGNLLKEMVTLNFTARPSNFQALKIALANTLKVGAYYDPIWIADSAINNPDTVLEGRSELWNIDRVTHAVTTTDFLVGEDGVEEFVESEVPYDSVDIQYGQVPLRSVTVDASISWDQKASGDIDFGSRVVFTYTGASLIDGWPKTDSSLQSGWSVKQGEAVDALEIEGTENGEYSYNWSNTASQHAEGDTMSQSASRSWPLLRGSYINCQLTLSTNFGVGHAEGQETSLWVPLWQVNTNLTLHYEADRKRIERVLFTVKTDTQPIMTLPDEDDTLILTMSSRDIGVTGEIGDVKNQAYLTSTRGQRSLQYLIAVARSKLLLRSRAVEVTFTCRFERAINLSLRKNALLHDRHFGGGTALGKIVKYSFDADAQTGEVIGSCTFASAIGYGGAVSASDGTPTYAEEGYMEKGYQQYIDQIEVLPASDIGYTVPITSPAGDGLRFPLDKSEVVLQDVWHNDNVPVQRAAIIQSFSANVFAAQHTSVASIEEQKAVATAKLHSTDEVLKAFGTYRELHLKPLTGGPFTTTYLVTVADLKVPKMLDLEAA